MLKVLVELDAKPGLAQHRCLENTSRRPPSYAQIKAPPRLRGRLTGLSYCCPCQDAETMPSVQGRFPSIRGCLRRKYGSSIEGRARLPEWSRGASEYRPSRGYCDLCQSSYMGGVPGK